MSFHTAVTTRASDVVNQEPIPTTSINLIQSLTSEECQVCPQGLHAHTALLRSCRVAHVSCCIRSHQELATRHVRMHWCDAGRRPEDAQDPTL